MRRERTAGKGIIPLIEAGTSGREKSKGKIPLIVVEISGREESKGKIPLIRLEQARGRKQLLNYPAPYYYV